MFLRVLCCFLLLRALVFADVSKQENLFQKIPAKNHLELRLPPEFQRKLLCQQEDSKDTDKRLNKPACKSAAVPVNETVERKHSLPPPNAPANDLCTNAIPISAGTFVAETCTATKDGSTGCQSTSG